MNKIRLTDAQLDRAIKEQLLAGFVLPGDESTYTPKEAGPDFGNFIMHCRKLIDSGKTHGELIDELIKLPKPEAPDREEDNEYQIPHEASGGEPSLPG